MKTVSVIVPVYNVAPTLLQRCLRSLETQTYLQLEVIVADDGSDVAVANAIRMPHRGLAATRNEAMGYATGDYVMFVDADDYLLPDCIERAVKEIGDRDILQFGMQRVTTEGEKIGLLVPHSFYRLTSACGRLYRRQWLNDNPIKFEEKRYYEDVYFSVRMWQLHPRHKVIGYAGYCYTVNPASITATVHEEDKKALCEWLKAQVREAKTIANKAIAAYTLVRVQGHFWKERNMRNK